ncbi:hypothetical protein FOCG_11101 [Fusarium oxysporum f. sp. radicis-lycopersici 26381]|uniref:Uncharacterized protein n=1 Tax=Fusarium oxysporum Fo47 TaxID=660027 RepID=W9KWJ3_FUSOX|nr:hypothetical protein FOZG_03105 [Fusarium oxysporum Fo47]EWZ47145.1 hypothetical protein FOZG_03105 [Fusarium oxysporum Fo47]EXL46756.1 hypothetical protein FOCG_11101 [Fusarium oxysporum f. sp. radicis-lycopersici 26381]EXL46757.1 hypothetical protein FOCG_11101 [Fusarium oxysporum f. sp. radicis-lycopersici 26381]
MGRFRERARNGLSIRTKWTVTEIDTHATVHFANACRYRTYHRDPIRARRRIIRSKKNANSSDICRQTCLLSKTCRGFAATNTNRNRISTISNKLKHSKQPPISCTRSIKAS